MSSRRWTRKWRHDVETDGVDPNLDRNTVPTDYVSKLKAAYRDEGPRPSLTQYGWVLEEA